MEQKRYNSRIVPKGDTEANWNKALGFIPLDKEIIIYKPDEKYAEPRIKIGDGKTIVQELPFYGGYTREEVQDLIAQMGDTKLDKTGGVLKGDLTIQGNLNVTGTTTAKDTETILVKDNTIVANSDGNELLEEAGFVIRKDAAAAYGIMYDPVGDGVKIGLGTIDENGKFEYTEGEDQFLATRDNAIADGSLVKWDNNAKKLVDSGEKISDYVKFTSYPTGSEHGPAGVVKVNSGVQGLQINPNTGLLLAIQANEDVIKNRYADKFYNQARHQGIPPIQLDLAIEEGLANCQKPELWTDDSLDESNETIKGTKAKARELLGAVGFTDYTAKGKYGVIRIDDSGYGLEPVGSGGALKISAATQKQIDDREEVYYNWPSNCKPIVPATVGYAVKQVLTNPKFESEVYTEEEQKKACETIGALSKDARAYYDFNTGTIQPGIVYTSPSYGLNVSQVLPGLITVQGAQEHIIKDRLNSVYVNPYGCQPLTMKNFGLVLKEMCKDNKTDFVFDDTEKTNVCNTFGAVKKDTSPITAKTVKAKIYAVDENGNQVMLSAVNEQSQNHTTEDKEFFKNSLVIRDHDGNIEISSMPYWGTHAASKWYVDNVPTYLSDNNKANWIEKLGVIKKDDVNNLPDHLTLTENSTDEEGNPVEGTRTKWLNWLGAVQAKPDNRATVKAYCVGTDGKQVMYNVGTSIAGAIPYTIALYLGEAAGDTEAGYAWLISKTPTKPYHTTTKKYVDEGFLAKEVSTSPYVRAYTINTAGEQQTSIVATTPSAAFNGSLTAYLAEFYGDTEAGGWLVSKTPTKPYHTTTKEYVDDNDIAVYEVSGVTWYVNAKTISQKFKVIVPKKNSINMDNYTDPSLGNPFKYALYDLLIKNNNVFEMVIGSLALSQDKLEGLTCPIEKVTLSGDSVSNSKIYFNDFDVMGDIYSVQVRQLL